MLDSICLSSPPSPENEAFYGTAIVVLERVMALTIRAGGRPDSARVDVWEVVTDPGRFRAKLDYAPSVKTEVWYEANSPLEAVEMLSRSVGGEDLLAQMYERAANHLQAFDMFAARAEREVAESKILAELPVPDCLVRARRQMVHFGPGYWRVPIMWALPKGDEPWRRNLGGPIGLAGEVRQNPFGWFKLEPVVRGAGVPLCDMGLFTDAVTRARDFGVDVDRILSAVSPWPNGFY